MFSKELTVERSLTARSAVSFVQKANQFHSDIKVKKGSRIIVDAKSILGLMTLSLQKGEKITIEANGNDERDAVHALQQLVSDSDLTRIQMRGKSETGEILTPPSVL